MPFNTQITRAKIYNIYLAYNLKLQKEGYE